MKTGSGVNVAESSKQESIDTTGQRPISTKEHRRALTTALIQRLEDPAAAYMDPGNKERYIHLKDRWYCY